MDCKRAQLLDRLNGYGRVAVALSAGVDSSVVAQAAALACREQAVAVTAASPSLAEGELEAARSLCKSIGLRHVVLRTEEFTNVNYTRNPSNRCYFCKTELYTQLLARRAELGFDVIANGANLDDRGDHRPGMQAAAEHAVRSPLIEVGLRKEEVRELAKAWGLPVWDKPAAPCLSSRIAYGVDVTPERVRRIDAAERWLRNRMAVRELRVRLEAGDLARIEVPPETLATLVASPLREQLTAKLISLGFQQVTLDLQGFRSGSLNAVLTEHELVRLDIGS
ncbi:MAG: ATP-dependent sacrificial sulfur transferase LarE [Planctomycetaceae bacterium]|nr:ATP-dependent sacrificial sulfur transferase LarE [Planctomycetaceae bacterium]